jgi:hypothetical protein
MHPKASNTRFWWKVREYIADHPEQRIGQAVFNVLAEVRPDLAERIRGTELDAFYSNPDYQDGKLDAMGEFIDKEW